MQYCSANNARTTAVLHVLPLAARVHTCPVAPKHAHSLSKTLKRTCKCVDTGEFYFKINDFTTDMCL